MPNQNQEPGQTRQAPGPGRSTSDQAFDELRREIAKRNEVAHREARKLRAAREREQLLRNRNRNS
jgi:hypothetical protein